MASELYDIDDSFSLRRNLFCTSSIRCIFVLMLAMAVSGEHRRVQQEDIDECVVFPCCDVHMTG